jgi:hypothetical protein
VRKPSVSQFLRDHYVDPTPISKEHRMPPSKYDPAKLPETAQEALTMAETHEISARAARDRDMHGSARHLELMALLLRHYAAAIDTAEKVT